MFDRFGVGSPSPFGMRGGVLAVGVHVVILAYGLHATTSRAERGGVYTAPESILVIPQAPERRGLPDGITVSAPDLRHLTLPLVPTIIPTIPGGTIEPGPIAVPTAPGGGYPGGDPDGVYDSNVLEQPPELLASPPPRYPELLRQAHIEGIVIIEGVVDTLGRMEQRTLRVVASPHPALSASAMECLAGAIFRPGRVEGRAVRVLVQVPVHFTVASR
jgi:TonB family protein